jgi:hypothetical protein
MYYRSLAWLDTSKSITSGGVFPAHIVYYKWWGFPGTYRQLQVVGFSRHISSITSGGAFDKELTVFTTMLITQLYVRVGNLLTCGKHLNDAKCH